MEKPENQLLVIFGASGDLTKRKLLPSLFELFLRRLLPDKFLILGAARSSFTDEEYRLMQKKGIIESQGKRLPEEREVDAFLELVHYFSFDPSDCTQYLRLKERIAGLQLEGSLPDNVIYYLATPPLLYKPIAECLKKNQMNKSGGWRRIVVEKPFGSDLKSALQLNNFLRSAFGEKEIYRIDHYMGKETVQNILVLRFSNGIFEPLWNRNYVDRIEISATETLGIENRGKYYERAGALRDMIQNHLMELMAFIAMEPPAMFDPESIRDEITKVFRSLHPAASHDVVRGQYTEGVSEGENVRGYRSEKDVAAGSVTETYVAMRFFIDNWRWGGVPFYFCTGKRLAEKSSEIVIHFKSTPQHFFTGECTGTSCNQLVIRIQPDEGISLRFGLKVPGAGFEVKQVSMDFRYDSLSGDTLPDAYERLLLDVMLGDSTLYSRSDALVASWEFIDPLLREWESAAKRNLFFYPAGSEGPEEGLALLQKTEECCGKCGGASAVNGHDEVFSE